MDNGGIIMKKTIYITLVIVLGSVFFLGLMGSEPVGAAGTIKWDISCWGNRRGGTEIYHFWAEEMEKRSGGRFKVTFNYGAVLSPAKENLDGIKAGLFDLGMFCSHFHPTKVPLHEVTNLPFFAPLEVDDAFRWENEIYGHPALVNWLAKKWNAVIVIPQILPRYEIMSKKPIRKVEEFKGIRVHASKAHGRIIEEYGAVITTITSPEIYNALDRGIVDAVVYPWTYAFGSYKLYEPAQYAVVGINFGIRNMPVVANKTKWDALPEDIKKIHQQLLTEMPEKAKEFYAKADEKWLPIFKKNVEFINFSTRERSKLLKLAQVTWDDWTKEVEAKGLPAKEVLDYAKAKCREITGGK
jgi:TRAP-type C4-dicarboxylate transport system substrate-binding protein